MSRDILIGYFFEGKDLTLIALHQAVFLTRAQRLPLPNEYASTFVNPPLEAHTNLPKILSGHFHRRLVLLEEVLTKEGSHYGLTAEDIRNWIAFERSYEKAMVQKEV